MTLNYKSPYNETIAAFSVRIFKNSFLLKLLHGNSNLSHMSIIFSLVAFKRELFCWTNILRKYFTESIIGRFFSENKMKHPEPLFFTPPIKIAYGLD